MRGLFHLSYFLWIVVPVALYATYTTFGLPHAIWRYEFYDNGSRYDPLRARHYTSCTFWGPYGMHTISASNGRCGYIAFFKEEVN